MKNGGIMDDIAVVGAVAAIVLAGWFLFKVLNRSENVEVNFQEKLSSMQNELHVMADKHDAMDMKNRDKQAQINAVMKDVKEMIEELKSINEQIDAAHDYMDRIRKSLTRVDHTPKKVELIVDPTKPLPVKIVKRAPVRKKTITRKTTVRTKSGTKSISESNTVPLKGSVSSFRKVKKKVTKKKKKATKKR